MSTLYWVVGRRLVRTAVLELAAGRDLLKEPVNDGRIAVAVLKSGTLRTPAKDRQVAGLS
ncbi:MAG: hypothetical protein HRU70_08785 [Phycisphaeraceae bacterium]|nr:MAG: hypothetical protein HRU70_08785 [Phycisphaeraceae bacterium]